MASLFERTLIKGDYADSSIIREQGRWWIFTSLPPYTAALFHPPPRSAHGQSTQASRCNANDSSRARPGGVPLLLEGELVRFARDSREGYGKKVRAMKLDKISLTTFREHPLQPDPLLCPGGQHWRWNGMHHISTVRLPGGRWIAVVDGKGNSLPDRRAE